VPLVESKLPRIVLPCLIMVGLGCRDAATEMVEVTGEVTFRERPLTTGAVVLQSDEGDQLEPARISAEGVYRLRAPAGAYRVAVIAMPSLNQENTAAHNPEESHAPVRLLLPEHYSRPETSRLQITVKPGMTNDIPLKLP